MPQRQLTFDRLERRAKISDMSLFIGDSLHLHRFVGLVKALEPSHPDKT